jgi:hypothetical protein
LVCVTFISSRTSLISSSKIPAAFVPFSSLHIPLHLHSALLFRVITIFTLHFTIDLPFSLTIYTLLNPAVHRKLSSWLRQLPQCKNPTHIAQPKKARARPMRCSISISQATSRRTTSVFNLLPSIPTATSGTTAFGAASLLPSFVSDLVNFGNQGLIAPSRYS